MNERLVDVIRLVKSTYSKVFLLHNVHGNDKTDLFLYLINRKMLEKEYESLDITFTYSINTCDGSLSLISNDIHKELHKAQWDMFKYGDEEDSFFNLSYEEYILIKNIVALYGTIDYDTLLTEMSRPTGNNITPELRMFLPFPYVIKREDILDNM